MNPEPPSDLSRPLPGQISAKGPETIGPFPASGSQHSWMAGASRQRQRRLRALRGRHGASGGSVGKPRAEPTGTWNAVDPQPPLTGFVPRRARTQQVNPIIIPSHLPRASPAARSAIPTGAIE